MTVRNSPEHFREKLAELHAMRKMLSHGPYVDLSARSNMAEFVLFWLLDYMEGVQNDALLAIRPENRTDLLLFTQQRKEG